MTDLGLDIIEYLRTNSNASMVRDASSVAYGDGIQCEYGGKSWFIALYPGDPRRYSKDPRAKRGIE